jgi:hypothetical protein
MTSNDDMYGYIIYEDWISLKNALNKSNMNETFGDQKMTILAYAIIYQRLEIVLHLIQLGCDVNAKVDKHGRTALTYASSYLYTFNADDIVLYVRALLNAGANVNAMDKTGVTALEANLNGIYVSMSGQTTADWRLTIPLDNHLKISKLLIDRGADVTLLRNFDLPNQLKEFINQRNQTRRGAIVIVALRHIHSNGRDVLRLIGKHVWSFRGSLENIYGL